MRCDVGRGGIAKFKTKKKDIQKGKAVVPAITSRGIVSMTKKRFPKNIN